MLDENVEGHVKSGTQTSQIVRFDETYMLTNVVTLPSCSLPFPLPYTKDLCDQTVASVAPSDYVDADADAPVRGVGRSISPPWGVNSISSGSPHVRPTGVHRTCGARPPYGIKKNTHPENTTALSRVQA